MFFKVYFHKSTLIFHKVNNFKQNFESVWRFWIFSFESNKAVFTLMPHRSIRYEWSDLLICVHQVPNNTRRFRKYLTECIFTVCASSPHCWQRLTIYTQYVIIAYCFIITTILRCRYLSLFAISSINSRIYCDFCSVYINIWLYALSVNSIYC